MKKLILFLKPAGLILAILGFVIPWYSWPIELVGDKVVINMFGSGTQISGWQLIFPQSLVHATPSSTGQYMMMQGISPADILKGVGTGWALVPILVLLFIVAAVVFWVVSRLKGQNIITDGFGPLLFGACILLLLVLWNAAPPAPLDKSVFTPAPGKYLTIFGALLLALGGLARFVTGRQVEQPVSTPSVTEAPAPKYRTCLKCHESVETNLNVCPHCGNKMN